MELRGSRNSVLLNLINTTRTIFVYWFVAVVFRNFFSNGQSRTPVPTSTIRTSKF